MIEKNAAVYPPSRLPGYAAAVLLFVVVSGMLYLALLAGAKGVEQTRNDHRIRQDADRLMSAIMDEFRRFEPDEVLSAGGKTIYLTKTDDAGRRQSLMIGIEDQQLTMQAWNLDADRPLLTNPTDSAQTDKEGDAAGEILKPDLTLTGSLLDGGASSLTAECTGNKPCSSGILTVRLYLQPKGDSTEAAREFISRIAF